MSIKWERIMQYVVLWVLLGIATFVLLVGAGTLVRHYLLDPQTPASTPTHTHVMCFDIDHRTASGPISLCVEGILADTGFAMGWEWYAERNSADWRIAPVSAGG